MADICNDPVAEVEDEFGEDFDLTTFLGNGHYGSVWKCVERKTGKEFAVKELDLAEMDEQDLKDAEREVEVRVLCGNVGEECVLCSEKTFELALSLTKLRF